MSEIFNSTNIFMAIFFLLMVVIAVISFQHSKNKISSKLFGYLTITAAFWVLTNLFANYAIQIGEPAYLFYTRVALVGPAFIPLLLILFADSFPNYPISLKKPWVYSLSIISLFIFSLFPTKYNIKSVEIINSETFITSFTPGWLYVVFSLFLLFGVIYATYILIRKIKLVSKIEKSQIIIVLMGLLFSIIGSAIINLIMPLLGNTYLINYGSMPVIFFIMFTAYAIIKYQMLEIKLIIAEIVSYLIVIFFAVEIFFSKTSTEVFFRLLFLSVAIYGGIKLVKSVQKEIKQREQIEYLAKDLKQANEELKELDKTKDDFLSMASHELNTPISAIEGYLSMILEEGMGEKIGPTTKKYLTRVFASSQRLAELVADLLNVSRIESGRIHIVYTHEDIIKVIEQAVAEIDSEVKKYKHKLTVNKHNEQFPKTWLDAPRIIEVIINLLGNSIKYTPPGGKLAINVKVVKDFFQVSVIDNGKGIPKDKKNKLFQKFTQASILEDEIKGTGLGLFIVKNFVELHGGKVWYESKVGKGTTFFFTVPIHKEKPKDPHKGEGSVLH